jgi:K+-sensing histidine kinase KdpD
VAVGERDGSVQIAIEDDGPARTPDELGRAFDLFASSARQAADPSGANLSMVAARRIVRRLGGEARAVRADHGGRVVVSLPLAT